MYSKIFIIFFEIFENWQSTIIINLSYLSGAVFTVMSLSNKSSMLNSVDLSDTDEDDDEIPAAKMKNKRKADDNQNENIPNKSNGNDLIQGDGDKSEVALKKKMKKSYKPFSEEILTGPDGLERLYNEFSRAQRQRPLFRGRGHEEQDLKNVIRMYREWGYQLYPGLAFSDLLNRIEALGSKSRVRNCMENLREKERIRYTVLACIYHMRCPES